jgi:hypothetical protein
VYGCLRSATAQRPAGLHSLRLAGVRPSDGYDIRRSASLDGAGPAAMKVFQIGHYVWVPYHALAYWPRYKREIERCLAQYGGKSAEEAAALVEERIRPTLWR